MPSQGENATLFLTAPPELGSKIVESVRERFPSMRWTVYLRAGDTSGLGDSTSGMEVFSDKPRGSKIGFLRRIRRGRSKLAVIAWTGDRSYNKMKLVGLLSAAQRVLIYNENLDSFFLDNNDGIWWRHLQWRASGGLSLTPGIVSTVVGLYKWTIGLAIGATWLLSRLAIRRLRLRWATAQPN